MDQRRSQSEVARLMHQIDTEHEAAQQGLSGLAIVATHASNTVRMHQGAERILGLIRQGKHEEADALMSTEYWEGTDVASESSISEEVAPAQ